MTMTRKSSRQGRRKSRDLRDLLECVVDINAGIVSTDHPNAQGESQGLISGDDSKDRFDRQKSLQETSLFFLENNSNYNEIIDHDYKDPSRPPLKGCNARYLRWLLRRFVQHLFVRLLTFILIVVDLLIVVAGCTVTFWGEEGTEDQQYYDKVGRILSYVDFGISIYFVIEISARIAAVGPANFFSRKRWFDIVDFSIVLITFSLAILEICYYHNLFDGNEVSSPTKLLIVLRLFRFVRLIRMFRLYTEHHQIKRAIRQFISQNKRRYQIDGHDLDLTYVTPRIIAMSFPSTGLRAWYRNNIRDVARFMDDRHKDHYRLYNLCSELSYNEEMFHKQVRHYPIDDHNIPSLKQMIDFVQEVQDWLQSDSSNVVAIHCKGGKGRTGTMICILLIYNGVFRDAQTSLTYFGERRSDKNVSQKFQGVETASQIRYVHYFDKMFKNELTLPEPVTVVISGCRIDGISSVGEGDGSDLSVMIHQRDLLLYDSSLICHVNEAGALEVSFPREKQLIGDVRIKFFCSTSSVPEGYEECAFFFWFNTSFLDDTDKANVKRLTLKREEIDNAHKQKTWKTFQEDFRIDLTFEVVQC